MKRLFCCYTYYHVLISALKTIKEKTESEIVLCWYEQFEDGFCQKLKNSGLFSRIYVYKKATTDDLVKSYGLINRMNDKNLERAFPKSLFLDKDVFIFNDQFIFGTALNYHKIKYTLIEDALDYFQIQDSMDDDSVKIKKKIKSIFGVGRLGGSKYTRTIEVNSYHPCMKLYNAKIVVYPRTELFSDIEMNDAERLFDIFGVSRNAVINDFPNGCLLVLTQPFVESGMLSIEEHIQLYRIMIEPYGKNRKIVIKPHPSDNTNYKMYFENCSVLDKSKYPIEILNLMGEEIKMDCITAFSSAIKGLSVNGSRVFLGSDWYEKTVRRIRGDSRS